MLETLRIWFTKHGKEYCYQYKIYALFTIAIAYRYHSKEAKKIVIHAKQCQDSKMHSMGSKKVVDTRRWLLHLKWLLTCEVWASLSKLFSSSDSTLILGLPKYSSQSSLIWIFSSGTFFPRLPSSDGENLLFCWGFSWCILLSERGTNSSWMSSSTAQRLWVRGFFFFSFFLGSLYMVDFGQRLGDKSRSSSCMRGDSSTGDELNLKGVLSLWKLSLSIWLVPSWWSSCMARLNLNNYNLLNISAPALFGFFFSFRPLSPLFLFCLSLPGVMPCFLWSSFLAALLLPCMLIPDAQMQALDWIVLPWLLLLGNLYRFLMLPIKMRGV